MSKLIFIALIFLIKCMALLALWNWIGVDLFEGAKPLSFGLAAGATVLLGLFNMEVMLD